MKKSMKLLSVILAIVMIFSTMSVMASAYQSYGQGGDNEYNSNDKGMAYLMTDEQRCSFVCDKLNTLLASANIKMSVAVIGDIDLTSLDKAFDTFDNLDGYLGIVGGDIKNVTMNSSNIGNKDVSLSNSGGAQDIINRFLIFLNDNADWINSIVTKGSIDLGLVGNFVTLPSTITSLIANLGAFAKEKLYTGVQMKTLTNKIGADPSYPDDTAWASLSTKPTLDSMLQTIIINLLTKPFHTTNITAASQNDIVANPTTYNATAAMIHTEAAVDSNGNKVYNADGTQATYWYIYGVFNDTTSTWTFTENSTDLTGANLDKQYITHWDTTTAILPEFDTSLIDFRTTSLYTLVSKALGIAYDKYAVPALDGSLRATLMEFCGAKNTKIETTDALHTTLYNVAKTYTAMTAATFASTAASTTGLMGTQKNFYFTNSGKLYYVIVDGYGEANYRIYSVDTSNVNAFYSNINWEYQAPAWSALLPSGYDATSSSLLENATDMVGKILSTAVVNLSWTYDSSTENNAHFEDNVMALVKRVVKIDPQKLLGEDFVLPSNFDSMSNEMVLVTIASDVMTWLMPSLVLPSNVTCLEELIAYGVREFVAEILPEYSWDTQLAAATTDDDYLQIALSMGTTIGAYYLKNILGLGTTTNGSGTTTVDVSAIPMGPSATWQTTLNYILDQVISIWAPDLMSSIKSNYSTIFAGTDPLAKFSAIFNSLFPGVLSLISGCTSTTFTTGVDLNNVYTLLKGLLNCQVEPIANKLYRNTSSLANSAIYTILVNVVEQLVSGLFGCGSNTYYTNITGLFTTCLSQTNPLEYLIHYNDSKPNTNLGTLVGNLIHLIYAYKSNIVQDVLTIVMQAMGAVDDSSYSSCTVKSDKAIYAGGAATVVPQVTLSVNGIPSSYYSGAFKTGSRTLDSSYTAKVTGATITNFVTGDQVATATYDQSLTNNTTVTLSSLSFTPNAAAAIYVLNVTIVVTAPDGTALDPVVQTAQFIATSTADTSIQSFNAISDSNFTFDVYNLFLDETQALTEANALQAKGSNFGDSSSRRFFINNYPTTTVNSTTGAVTLSTSPSSAAKWNVTINGGTTTAYNAGASVAEINNKPVPFYWYWNQQYKDKYAAKSSSISGTYWITDATTARSDFLDDFTVLDFEPADMRVGYKTWIGTTGTAQTSWKGVYIVVYNTHGLTSYLKNVLNENRLSTDYTTDSWATYQTALSNAIAEIYAAKDYSTFVSVHSHTDDTTGEFVNEFTECKTALEDAIKGLTKVADATQSAYTTAQTTAIASLKTQLTTEEAKQLDNKDYIAYRWWKYNDAKTAASKLYNSLVVPTGVADSTLAGVNSSDITAVTAAVPSAYTALVQAMTVAPTTEQTKAAQATKTNFLANLPKVDITAINNDIKSITTNYTRLISKDVATSTTKQYLNSAISLVTTAAPVQANYTTESWAAYATALANAQAANTSSTALNSTVHKTRYELLKAYKGLTLTSAATDYTALQALATQAQTVLNNQSLFELATGSSASTLTAAFTDILKATGYAVTLNGGAYNEADYVIGGSNTAVAALKNTGLTLAVNEQTNVDALAAALKAALAEVTCKIQAVTNTSVSGNTTVVTQSDFLIDGIQPGAVKTADALKALITTTAPTGYTAVLTPSASAAGFFGTGAKVVLSENTVGTIATYTLIIHGDVNGDSAIDGFDAFSVDKAANSVAALSGSYLTAGDTNNDGSISTTDYIAIQSAAAGLTTLSQTA